MDVRLGYKRVSRTLCSVMWSPLIGAALLLGCATPSTTLVNQDLQTIRCSGTSRGHSGTPLVLASRDRCVREFKSMGYLELPDVVLGVKPLFIGTAPFVHEVVTGSPADKAGMKPGDVIQSMGGSPVQSFKDFVVALSAKRAGDVLPIVVHRSGATLEFAPVLERR